MTGSQHQRWERRARAAWERLRAPGVGASWDDLYEADRALIVAVVAHLCEQTHTEVVELYARAQRAISPPLPDAEVTRILEEHRVRQLRAAVAAEREACARIADDRSDHHRDQAEHIAAAIRARGGPADEPRGDEDDQAK